MYAKLNAMIRGQNFNTAVSILSLPSLPESDASEEASAQYLFDVDVLTKGIGPAMLTKAQEGSDVITTDL